MAFLSQLLYGGRNTNVNVHFNELTMIVISENWKKINNASVCFGSKDDAYGNFSNQESALIFTFKLVHRNGALKCGRNYPATHWVCFNCLSTVITYKNRTALLLADYFRNGNSCGLSYYGYHVEGTGLNSQELVFNRLSPQLLVSIGEEFQIWYGEDLLDCYESDNSGQTCVDVYAWYV